MVSAEVQEGGMYWARLDGVHVLLKVLQKPDNPFGLWRCEAPAPFNYEIQVPEEAFTDSPQRCRELNEMRDLAR